MKEEEKADRVERAIKEIKKSKNITEDNIIATCEKYNISVDFLKLVTGWNEKITYLNRV